MRAGTGLDRTDPARALELFRVAAERNDTTAMCRIVVGKTRSREEAEANVDALIDAKEVALLRTAASELEAHDKDLANLIRAKLPEP